MSNFSSKQRLILGLATGITVAISFAARSAASWRPRLIGVHPGARKFVKGASKLLLSPTEQTLICWSDNNQNGYEWNLSTGAARQIQGTQGAYSPDGHWLVTRSETNKLFVYSPTKLEWQRDFTANPKEDHLRVNFANANNLVVSTDHWIRIWNLQTGKRIEQRPAPANWKQTYWDEYATPPLAPDGKRLKWTIHEFHGFDVLDARTENKQWTYSSPLSDSGINFCYPHFENGGKELVTIEQNALVVRDSRTGIFRRSYPNKLRVPPRSWTFNQDGSALYSINNKGQIFRQRLR